MCRLSVLTFGGKTLGAELLFNFLIIFLFSLELNVLIYQNNIEILDSERISDECISFTMMCFLFFFSDRKVNQVEDSTLKNSE